MKIAVVGAGNVGRLYGRRWVERGHDVAFGYARDAAALDDFVATLGSGAEARRVADLASDADVVVFAVPFEQIEDAAARLGPLNGTVLVDTTNPFNPERTGLVELDGSTSSEKVASLFPGARVVKALHNLSVDQVSQAAADGTPAVLFLAGDDAGAKDMVAKLIGDAGLAPFDTGSLASARLSEAPGPLFMTVHTPSTAGEAFGAAHGELAVEADRRGSMSTTGGLPDRTEIGT